MIALTVVGVLAGLIASHVPSAIVGALVRAAAQATTSHSGGWGEAGAIGGIVWLAGTGGIVGAVQRLALPGPRGGWWPTPVLGLIWGMAHPLHGADRRARWCRRLGLPSAVARASGARRAA